MVNFSEPRKAPKLERPGKRLGSHVSHGPKNPGIPYLLSMSHTGWLRFRDPYFMAYYDPHIIG